MGWISSGSGRRVYDKVLREETGINYVILSMKKAPSPE